MPNIDAKTILAILGPLFLLLATWRAVQAGALVPQARTWFIVGTIFSLVALWLWFGQAR
ncbi:hypothetical protein [Piscinibacter gummiphilus]|uniref:Uncharacterized protein n=1 Tax=Piscinibacter gummiphilus TaxID=946333 RepID=A0ABZ0CMH1_9BURK|nr:hypothetical protein [Piscinibacter gummiphilus]WOB06084.1 hypothetical protein RXV79_14245 [Piscinibacter gummiphilus]